MTFFPLGIAAMINAITGFIADQGYWAIALLMFAENVFPPLQSELITPFAGFAAARGELHPALVVAAGAFGSVLGALPWFFAARHWGAERVKRMADRHGRWLTVSRAELDRSEQWFHRRRVLVLVFGRLAPGVRTLVAVPAGLSAMMPMPFFAWWALGSLLWSAPLAEAGYILECRDEEVAKVLEPAARVVLAAIIFTYFWRVVRAGRR